MSNLVNSRFGAGFGTYIGTKRAARHCSASGVEHLPVNSAQQSSWRHRFKKAASTFLATIAANMRAPWPLNCRNLLAGRAIVSPSVAL